MRTRSLRKSADIATVISGETNEIAVASTTGSRASAEKLQNMAPTAVSPRPMMAERAADADRCLELAAPGIDDDHRQDGEGRAEEHHLPDRIAIAEIAHEHRHHGKDQGRRKLEQDGFDEIDRPRAPATAEQWRRDEMTAN